VAIDLARERDPDMLRQIARLLEAENAWLHRRLAELTRARAAARGEAQTQLALELRQLQEQLAARTQALYGRSSERRGRRPDADANAADRPPPPQCGHGPRTQPSLPLVEVTHTLDAADETCPKCGGHLEAWTGQTEDAEEIDVVERQFVLKRHRRQKYRRGCGECIDTALGPPKLVAGGRYSVDFAVAVAVGKVSVPLFVPIELRAFASLLAGSLPKVAPQPRKLKFRRARSDSTADARR
jgi:transposase